MQFAGLLFILLGYFVFVLPAILIWRAFKASRRLAAWAFAIATLVALVTPSPTERISIRWVNDMFTVRHTGGLSFNRFDPSMLEEPGKDHRFYRYRYGFPWSATTIDVNLEGRGSAGVVEEVVPLVNILLCAGAAAALVIGYAWLVPKIKLLRRT